MRRFLIVLFLMFIVALNAEWVTIDNVNNSELFTTNSRSLDEIDIEFELDGYELELLEKAGQTFSKISYPNEGEFINVGKPDLPRFTRLVAIPDFGDVELEIINQEFDLIEDLLIYPRQDLISESQPYNRSFMIDEEYYRNGERYPAQNVSLGNPAIMRDYRVVSVTIDPFQYDPKTKQLKIVKKVNVIVHSSSSRGENEKIRDAKRSRYFDNLYKSTILNYSSLTTRDEFQNPSYLFIYNDNNNNQVSELIEQLVEWKHQKGFEVTAVGVDEIGNNSNQIKNYIQNAYDTWENRPEFITFIGDGSGSYNIPTYTETWSGYSGEGDHPYSQLDGDDILADVATGRLTFTSPTQLATIMAKIFNYEREPYMDETDWYDKAAFFGDPSISGQSCVDTKVSIAEMMEVNQPNIETYEMYSGSWVSQMSAQINDGISYYNYRGWLGMSGWGNGEINSLNNGPQLPFAVILTCGTGSWANGTSRSEAFLQAGTPSIPKGAIGSVGTATSGTHTCFNNCVDTGMYYGIFAERNYTMGQSLLRGKLNLYLSYPDNPSNKVSIFSHWNTLMGDPGLELWTAVPEDLDVSYNENISLGTNNITVEVNDSSGNPLENAWVCALQGDDLIFANAFTDNNGMVTLPVMDGEEGSVNLTVTAHNFIPHLGQITIGDAYNSVVVQNIQIDDTAGNNDNWANPGESINLEVTLMNNGDTTSNNTIVELFSTNEFITIEDTSVNFGDITSGATATASYAVTLDSSILGSTEVKLNFMMGAMNSDIVMLPIVGAALMINQVNCEIDPGDTSDLTLTLENYGALDLEGVWATLESEHDFITFDDATGFFATIIAGDTSVNTTNNFSVHCNNNALPGTQYPMVVELTTTDGYSQEINFILEVGEVEITDPLGPDAGGYVCFDMGDLDYYQVPTYDWIEINNLGTDLNFNDSGNMGDTELVDLPFDFQFYGITYDQITICSNGWIAMGETDSKTYMNWSIPGADGPSPMIAPFWDDLIASNGSAYYYYDASQNYFVIEWDGFKNQHVSSLEETFQVILYDTSAYATISGNGNIKFQYKEFNNVDAGSYGGGVSHGAYATIGLEDHTGTVGLGYSFYNQYPTAAMELGDETALFFTETPIPLDQPFLVFHDVVIDDANGNLDHGETVDFNVLINNLGENPATSINTVISSDDEYVTINNAASTYADIDNALPGENLTPFNISVPNDCPNGHVISFDLTVEAEENSWNLSFNVLVNAPEIQFVSSVINDGDNYILDAGETTDLLLEFNNIGGSHATNAIINLSIEDEYITLGSTEFNFGTFVAGSTANAPFEVTASEDAPIGYIGSVDWSITADLDYGVSGTTTIVVSQIPVHVEEHFDVFPPEGWTLEGIDNGGNWNGSDTNQAGGTAPEAKINWSPQFDGEQRLVSAPINTLGSGSLNLEFKHMLNDFGGSNYVIGAKSTSDGGETWHTIWEVEPFNDISAETIEVEVQNSDVGSDQFQIAFYFNGGSYNLNYWYLDDVILSGGSGAVLGFVEGNVTLSGAGDVTDVQIDIGGNITQPDENGNYFLTVAPGSYQLNAELDGYETYTQANVEVIFAQTTTVDISMQELEELVPPVNLEAEVDNDMVTLSWEIPLILSRSNKPLFVEKQTVQEKNNRDHLGYKVFRDEQLIETINNPTTMEYQDQALENGIYEYYVTAIYTAGESSESNIVEVAIDLTDASVDIPLVTKLLGNYPNPFNPTTTIGFALHLDDNVVLNIYNIKGQKVKSLINNRLSAGHHSIVWDGKDSSDRDVTSGVYFYKMKTSTYSEIKQMILIK